MRVLAAVAHPDDTEFQFAGSLLLLQRAGCEIHMINLGNGHGGTDSEPKEVIVARRRQEAMDAAALVPATMHPPLFDDLAIFYDDRSLKKVSAVVREVRPDMILTHHPTDYMEDHQNTCRLVVTAAFSRGMLNLETDPPRPGYSNPVRIYHALPHGSMNYRGEAVEPDFFVNIGSVLEKKRAMLAAHRSQKEWLDASQGMGSYTDSMVRMASDLGHRSGIFSHAEGMIRHNPLGLCPPDFDPLTALLKDFCTSLK
jgi:LmbE family N-acetylglucosaminyl deacetylase